MKARWTIQEVVMVWGDDDYVKVQRAANEWDFMCTCEPFFGTRRTITAAKRAAEAHIKQKHGKRGGQ